MEEIVTARLRFVEPDFLPDYKQKYGSTVHKMPSGFLCLHEWIALTNDHYYPRRYAQDQWRYLQYNFHEAIQLYMFK